jgi:CheY-like chemotaxis protein
LSILIADDYADAVEMYTEYLEWSLPPILERPIRIVPAPDGASALEQLQESRFDLVVTDLNMPWMSGETLIRRIRDGETEIGSNSTPRSVAIILLTPLSAEQAQRLREQKDHGVIDEVVDKPCLPDDLATEVLGVLHRRGIGPGPHRSAM